jgi:hypothetical protein
MFTATEARGYIYLAKVMQKNNSSHQHNNLQHTVGIRNNSMTKDRINTISPENTKYDVETHTSECLAIHEHNNKQMVLTELLSQITRADITGYQRKVYINRS